MYFGRSLRRRPGSWATRLAFRSTATALVALIAAYVVQSKALPALTREMSELGNDSPAAVSWLMGLRGWLIVVPLPGLILGIAAIALRRLRPILSPLAALASLAAVVALVATLAASLVPMYQIPAELFEPR